MRKTTTFFGFSNVQSFWCMLALVAALAITGTNPAQAAPDPMEGKWNLTLVSDDGKTIEDIWTFKVDKLSSNWAIKQGFKEPVPCDIDTRGGQSRTFLATAKNGKAELKWSGTAALGEISGTLTYTKEDGSTVSYTYKGKKAEK